MANPYANLSDFFDRYDLRTELDLSGDDNDPNGDRGRVGRLLDAQASRLETALSGRYPLPALISGTSLTANVAAGAASFSVGSITGLSVGQRIYLGPDGTNQPEAITIGAIASLTVSLLVPNLTAYAHLSGTTLFTVPGVLTDWVCTKTALRLFGRRPDRPAALDADNKDADEWLEKLMAYRVTIPGLGRAVPQLQDSNYTDGRSRWDWIYGLTPSKTGPSGGK